MADLDNASKRRSHVQMLKPYAAELPWPTGDIDQADRQHLVWLYSGILAEIIAGQPFLLRLFGVPTMARRDRPGGWN